MKKILLFSLLFFGWMAQAQSPQINVKGVDSLQVRMSELFVNVKVVGNIAYTTAEMHFVNSSARQMEAELLFPLPEGVSVSRYAIDINGKMREAVPVNKNKGKQVFEAVEHRRVDPGLLEKVEGNNFKTRIYPILPNQERIVVIGYEQELSGFDKKNLRYQLVSRYPQKLDKFELVINVVGAASKPSIIDDANSIPSFEKGEDTTWSQSYLTSIKRDNYKPSEKLLIKIPIRQEIPSVVVQSVDEQHYFYANTIIESNKKHKKNPNSIGLIWDNSLSCKNRDLKKELQLLDGYFNELKNVEVTLYLLNYNFEKGKIFTISNGNWSALKTELENTNYDGGTRFSKLKLMNHDEYMFFTDGLSSLSDNVLEKTNKPIFTITSLPSSDYAFLNYNALKTGGNFINLNELNIADALDKIVYDSLKFLGIKENYLVAELYPMTGMPVSGNFSVSGISLKSQNEIVLLFGYDNKAVLEKKIVIDVKNQNSNDVNIEKLWAQKKIANLEMQYKKNAEEIEALGKKYGIITQNTSLIVLEDINDYIQYDIIPPAELRAEFDRIQKERQESAIATRHSNWEKVSNYHAELASWWNKNIEYVKPKPVLVKPEPVHVKSNPIYTKYSKHGKKRKKAEAEKDQKGDEDQNVIIDQPTGAADVEAEIVEPNYGREQMNERQGVKTESVTSTAVQTWNASPNGNVIRSLAGKVSGLQINNGVVTDSISNPSRNSGSFNNNDTKIKSWNPDRIYLKALAAVPKEKRYDLYLELRNEQQYNPSFYFDVANYFYNEGDKQKAVLILSNIADLGLENHQLYKSLTYQLRQWEAYEDALFTARQVVKWREHEPQSHRDLALTLEDNKEYQAAFEELIKALEVNYFGEMSGHYEGVEDIILMDINRMTADHNGIKTEKLDGKYLNKMPVAIRIILNWNQMDTDIDLHVIEPTGEECYYGHKNTDTGARFSKDFTRGYGPEQYLLRNALKGKFIIKTNYYGERTLTENGPTTVMVEIYTTRANGITERKLQTIQLGTVKEKQNLAEITID